MPSFLSSSFQNLRKPSRIGLLLCALSFFLCSCQNVKAPPFDASAQDAELLVEVEGGASRAVPFQELAALEALPGLTHHDHLFGEDRRYVGLNLAHLQLLAQADPEQKVLKLHCRDGYVSEVELSVLKQGQFLLAFRDVDAAPKTFLDYEEMSYLQSAPDKLETELAALKAGSEEREKLRKKVDHLKTLRKDMKALGNQGPFYPIFIPSESLPKEKRWFPPFCVSKITFARSKTDKTAALPKGLSADHPVMKGSKLFSAVCSSCHRINGIGGTVGPELNRPMSVVEYWDKRALRQMMKDPGQVRDGSKMPAFHLSEEKIDQIVAYLSWMSEHKLVEDVAQP